MKDMAGLSGIPFPAVGTSKDKMSKMIDGFTQYADLMAQARKKLEIDNDEPQPP